MRYRLNWSLAYGLEAYIRARRLRPTRGLSEYGILYLHHHSTNYVVQFVCVSCSSAVIRRLLATTMGTSEQSPNLTSPQLLRLMNNALIS